MLGFKSSAMIINDYKAIIGNLFSIYLVFVSNSILCVCVCVCMCVVCMRVCVCVWCACVRVCVCTYKYICEYSVHVHVCLHVCVCVHEDVCKMVCMYIYVFVNMCKRQIFYSCE